MAMDVVIVAVVVKVKHDYPGPFDSGYLSAAVVGRREDGRWGTFEFAREGSGADELFDMVSVGEEIETGELVK
jgi:hypothetical protein